MIFDWRGVPEFTPDGTVTSVLGVSRDITDLDRTQRAQLDAQWQSDVKAGAEEEAPP